MKAYPGFMTFDIMYVTDISFFIVTTANLQSTPKGAISKWEGGYDGKEESSIDDTPKCPLGGGRQELDAVLGLQIRWPLTLQSPSDGGGRGQGSNEDVVVTG